MPLLSLSKLVQSLVPLRTSGNWPCRKYRNGFLGKKKRAGTPTIKIGENVIRSRGLFSRLLVPQVRLLCHIPLLPSATDQMASSTDLTIDVQRAAQMGRMYRLDDDVV